MTKFLIGMSLLFVNVIPQPALARENVKIACAYLDKEGLYQVLSLEVAEKGTLRFAGREEAAVYQGVTTTDIPSKELHFERVHDIADDYRVGFTVLLKPMGGENSPMPGRVDTANERTLAHATREYNCCMGGTSPVKNPDWTCIDKNEAKLQYIRQVLDQTKLEGGKRLSIIKTFLD